ncbi:MAG: hypothetical protein ACLUE8_18665 [Lachnospiraceae bacterium]
MDDRFPKITQEGRDGDGVYGYIANMCAIAPPPEFKYFDCRGVRRVSVRTKGFAGGQLELRTAWDGEPLGSIPIGYANVARHGGGRLLHSRRRARAVFHLRGGRTSAICVVYAAARGMNNG